MGKKLILLADNDKDYSKSLVPLLELKYRVELADSVALALDMMRAKRYDLILADLRLTNESDSDMTGLTVAGLARELKVPCLLITARPSVAAARASMSSIDAEPLVRDMIPKADGPQSLLTAMNAALSHTPVEDDEETDQDPLSEDLCVDLDKKLVWLHGERLRLYSHQYRLLAYLYERKGKVCQRKEIMQAVYGAKALTDLADPAKSFEQLLARLRKSLKTNARNSPYLVTEAGLGIRLVTNPEQIEE